MSEITEGNILDIACKNCLIMHQVNCQGIISDDMTKIIAEKYPRVAERYKKLCRTFFKNPRELLGEILYHKEENNVYIADSFSQFGKSAFIKQTDEDLLIENIKKGALFAEDKNVDFYIPYGIGCGSGRGNWAYIEDSIKDLNVKIVKNKEI